MGKNSATSGHFLHTAPSRAPDITLLDYWLHLPPSMSHTLAALAPHLPPVTPPPRHALRGHSTAGNFSVRAVNGQKFSNFWACPSQRHNRHQFMETDTSATHNRRMHADPHLPHMTPLQYLPCVIGPAAATWWRSIGRSATRGTDRNGGTITHLVRARAKVIPMLLPHTNWWRCGSAHAELWGSGSLLIRRLDYSQHHI